MTHSAFRALVTKIWWISIFQIPIPMIAHSSMTDVGTMRTTPLLPMATLQDAWWSVLNGSIVKRSTSQHSLKRYLSLTNHGLRYSQPMEAPPPFFLMILTSDVFLSVRRSKIQSKTWLNVILFHFHSKNCIE